MATKPPTVAQQLDRFNRWMRKAFPKFAYTQTQAEKLLRDYRMGRASLPTELVSALSGKVLPAKVPAKKVPTRRGAPAKKVLPAKLPAKRTIPKPTPRAAPPIIIRPEPRHAPPARPTRHAAIEDDLDFDADYIPADELDYDEDVEIGELGITRWMDDWDDIGNLDVDVLESDS